MKLLSALVGLSLAVALPSREACAEEQGSTSAEPSPPGEETAASPGAAPTAASGEPAAAKPGLDFDFFGGAQAGKEASAQEVPSAPDALGDALAAKAHTRRWMLRAHQTLGLATWALMVGTVVVGQLNYNQLYGGGGGSLKWQTPHRVLLLSTAIAYAAAASFAIIAPTPFKKPLRFDTGLIHRIAVSAATLGMVTQMVLGWVTTRRADAGNPHDLSTLARTHQVVGYATLGCLTVAGMVWVF